MRRPITAAAGVLLLFATLIPRAAVVSAHDEEEPTLKMRHPALHDRLEGKRLFERETFGGNGRTCATCHSDDTGTVSPRDARLRFLRNPRDPLFRHDGSDDGNDHGVTRMLTDATVLVQIPLPPNVSLRDDPTARTVTLRRGIPSTLNTPALDPVLMLDGRQPNLEAQAAGAIRDHAENVVIPTGRQLELIADFEASDRFFSSPALRRFARGGSAPRLPEGRSASERRGRRFFLDLPPDETFKDGLCASCHSGAMLNQTNQFLPFPQPVGSRFQSVGVSEINEAKNPVRDFVFHESTGDVVISSPDPGRALITGIPRDIDFFDNVNAFKIPSLWGVRRTAPYFHDNSAKTLDAVASHYATFFSIASDPDGPGPLPPLVVLTAQDQADIVAYLKLLD